MTELCVITWLTYSSLLYSTQLRKLQTVLYSSKEEETEPMALQDNYRTTQPLNHRTVQSSFIPGRRERKRMKEGRGERTELGVGDYVAVLFVYMMAD